MINSKILKNRATYTSDTEDIKVNVSSLEKLIIGYDFLQNGTTAPTLANLVGMTNEIKVKIGGEIVTLVRHDDLFALNHLLWNHKPFYLLPAGNDQVGIFTDIWLPVNVTTDKLITVQLTYNGHTTIDTEKLTLSALHGLAQSPKPLSLQYISGNTATSFTEFDIDQSGKSLLALLIYNTTIPTASALDATIGELKLLIKRKERFHTHFFNMKQVLNWHPEDTTIGGILDNYALVDLRKNPYPADDLKVAIKSLANATDAFRILGVYR